MIITRDILDALPSVSLRGRVYVAKDALLAFIALDIEEERVKTEPEAASPVPEPVEGELSPLPAPRGHEGSLSKGVEGPAVPRRLKVIAHAIPEPDE